MFCFGQGKGPMELAGGDVSRQSEEAELWERFGLELQIWG